MSKPPKKTASNRLVEALAEALTTPASSTPAAAATSEQLPDHMAQFLAMKQKNLYLLDSRFPEIAWELAGAFSEAKLLIDIHEFFIRGHGLKLFSRVQGAPPCIWAGGLAAIRGGLKSQEELLHIVTGYNQWAIGITADFSNPAIEKAHLVDIVGNSILEMLARYNNTGLNGILTDSPLLSGHVRLHYPTLRQTWLASRAPMEKTLAERQEHYRKLAGHFDRVQIHPDDANDRDLLAGLGSPHRYSLPIDDPCDRNCPFRNEHRLLVAAIDQCPLDAALRIREGQILEQQGCRFPSGHREAAGRSLVLTDDDRRWLFQQGFRSWLVQGGRQHTGTGLALATFQQLFNHDPDISHVIARIWQKFFLWRSMRSF